MNGRSCGGGVLRYKASTTTVTKVWNADHKKVQVVPRGKEGEKRKDRPRGGPPRPKLFQREFGRYEVCGNSLGAVDKVFCV